MMNPYYQNTFNLILYTRILGNFTYAIKIDDTLLLWQLENV